MASSKDLSSKMESSQLVLDTTTILSYSSSASDVKKKEPFNHFARGQPAQLLPSTHNHHINHHLNHHFTTPSSFFSPLPTPPSSFFPLSPPHFPIRRFPVLLFDSLALSAWKATSFSTWFLRVNPPDRGLHC
ncbi:hypothetical protein ACSQ67_021056 [Phaseolus vulgaris]